MNFKFWQRELKASGNPIVSSPDNASQVLQTGVDALMSEVNAVIWRGIWAIHNGTLSEDGVRPILRRDELAAWNDTPFNILGQTSLQLQLQAISNLVRYGCYDIEVNQLEGIKVNQPRRRLYTNTDSVVRTVTDSVLYSDYQGRNLENVMYQQLRFRAIALLTGVHSTLAKNLSVVNTSRIKYFEEDDAPDPENPNPETDNTKKPIDTVLDMGKLIKAGSFTIPQIASGHLEKVDIPDPVLVYEQFTYWTLKEMGMFLGVTDLPILVDLSKLNFASGELTNGLDRPIYFRYQNLLMPLLRILWQYWADAMAFGIDNSIEPEYGWYKPRLSSINPQKAIQNDLNLLSNNLVSRRQLWLKYGHHPDEMMEELGEPPEPESPMV